ncbi:DUF1462 family protein, partial [Staphylococcus epidermidis]|uniref:DUF1462 family protein n=1 Tax=Staphylococcus epidermidis TaxID=1282 RepID=UPI0011A6ABB4
MTKIALVLYPPEVLSPSSLNPPTSIHTYQSLQPLLLTNFPQHHFQFTYIHIPNHTQNLTHHHIQFIETINQHQFFYPLVTI